MINNMNTLNYIGCKHTLLEKLTEIIEKNIPDTREKSFLDLFAGTGIVGFNMRNKFKTVSANDLEVYSYIINSALLKASYSPRMQSLIDDCNEVSPVEGLIYTNYSPNENCERMFFTSENAQKCDAIRSYIDTQFEQKNITENERVFLIASLLVSMDKVANTASVYGSYLKEYKKTALKPLVLTPIHKNENANTSLNRVYNQKAEDLVNAEDNTFWDVIYLDPPYNQRQYAANYAPLNYIAQYTNLTLKGKTGLIEDYNKSEFCSKTKVKSAFEKLIKNSKCSYLLLSYNNEGLLDIETLKTILREKGNVKLHKIEYKKFKSFKGDNTKVEEYFWVIDVVNKKEGELGSFEELTI
jgi:adenine-specific DNA-methyltransferase